MINGRIGTGPFTYLTEKSGHHVYYSTNIRLLRIFFLFIS